MLSKQQQQSQQRERLLIIILGRHKSRKKAEVVFPLPLRSFALLAGFS
jgi:hypothetical protein